MPASEAPHHQSSSSSSLSAAAAAATTPLQQATQIKGGWSNRNVTIWEISVILQVFRLNNRRGR